MSHRILLVATALFVAAAGSAFVAAQQPVAAPKTVWDGVYTDAQATRGAAAFAANCARCHGNELQGASARTLIGDTFARNWNTRTVQALFKYVSTNMPNGNGGSLDGNTYQDLVAFILSRNMFPAGMTELTADSGLGVRIVGKDGPLPLADKSVAGVVGCLVKGGDTGWRVAHATSPRRLESATTVPPEAATEALGSGEVPLLFVLPSLDRINGQRVFVRGLLVGENGSGGINVIEVRPVGMTCP